MQASDVSNLKESKCAPLTLPDVFVVRKLVEYVGRSTQRVIPVEATRPRTYENVFT